MTLFNTDNRNKLSVRVITVAVQLKKLISEMVSICFIDDKLSPNVDLNDLLWNRPSQSIRNFTEERSAGDI